MIRRMQSRHAMEAPDERCQVQGRQCCARLREAV